MCKPHTACLPSISSVGKVSRNARASITEQVTRVAEARHILGRSTTIARSRVYDGRSDRPGAARAAVWVAEDDDANDFSLECG